MDDMKDLLSVLVAKRQTNAGTADGLFPFVAPPGPASENDLASLTSTVGGNLPPSLRAFLARMNGWPKFFQHIDMLSTAEMVHGKHLDRARSTLRMAAEVYGPVWDDIAFTKAVVIGFSLGEGDMIFLNPLKTTTAGEWEAVWFHHDVVERRENLTQLLGVFADLMR